MSTKLSENKKTRNLMIVSEGNHFRPDVDLGDYKLQVFTGNRAAEAYLTGYMSPCACTSILAG
jgi:hypothetical protein